MGAIDRRQNFMDRILEPEVMDTWLEATAYDAMDFSSVIRHLPPMRSP